MVADIADLEFGGRLRSERVRLGYTQQQLAHIMGVKQLTVFQYEKGNTKPNLSSIYSLQNAGFRMQFLIFGRDNVPKPSDLPPHIIEMVSRLVSEIESKFGGGNFSDETKFRMFLILLNQYIETSATVQLNPTQAFELFLKG